MLKFHSYSILVKPSEISECLPSKGYCQRVIVPKLLLDNYTPSEDAQPIISPVPHLSYQVFLPTS